jgi:CheY-like chemotaxis protein
VLDDEEAVLRLLHEVLSRAGFEVVCTTDGYAALERLEREVFRAFLMDLKMPAIDGVEILSRLDGLEPAARPAVVVVTGAEAGLVPAELEPIISTRLEKPFTRNEVLARLREALGPSPEPETETETA